MIIKNIEPELISECRVSLAAGKPGECVARVHAPDNSLSSLAGMKELALFTDSEKPLFFGYVEEFSLESSTRGNSVLLKALSHTSKEKEEPRRRFFQKPDKTYGDIFDRVKLEKCSLKVDSALKSKPYKPILMQAENNFDFLKKLAESAGRKFWVIDNIEGGPGFAVDFALEKAREKVEPDKIINLKKIIKNGEKRAQLVYRKHTGLGRLLILPDDGVDYLVTSLFAYSNNGRDEYVYGLEKYKDEDLEPMPEGRAELLQGRIKDNQDPDKMGRVRVEIDPEFAEDDRDKSWLPLLTPYAGKESGVVFVPDKDDLVEILFSQGRALVLGACRENPLAKEAEDVNNKFIGDNFGQRIIWKKDSLETRSGDDFIVLKQDEIAIHTDKVDMKLDGAGLKIDAAEDVNLSVNGEMKLAASGDAILKGGKVKLG